MSLQAQLCCKVSIPLALWFLPLPVPPAPFPYPSVCCLRLLSVKWLKRWQGKLRWLLGVGDTLAHTSSEGLVGGEERNIISISKPRDLQVGDTESEPIGRQW